MIRVTALYASFVQSVVLGLVVYKDSFHCSSIRSTMSEVVLVVLEDGQYSDRYWEVRGVCSTLEKAQAQMRELIISDFMQSKTGVSYESPYHLQIWKTDGERVDAPDDTSNEPTIYQIAKTHPEVDAELKNRIQIAEDKDKLLQEHEARQTRVSMRRELDIKLLNGDMTKKEYVAAVNEHNL